MSKHRLIVGLSVVLMASAAWADTDWSSLPYTPVSTFEAVNASGSSAYSGGFPIRMIGVVLNNTEDYLDPTPAFDSGYHPYNLGGQAQIYVQTIAPGDFGGVGCWIGQNYGNMPWNGDASFSYTNAQWTAELGRLDFYGGDGVTQPIRAGDLVEIRARAGLAYDGVMNVNEEHSTDPAMNFDVIVLQRGYGLPTPATLSLSDLKNADNSFIFDSTRQRGDEHYQGSLVDLQNVWVSSAANWSTNTDITVTDGVRTFDVYLGLNPSFNGASLFAPGAHFDVMGILDQDSDTGQDGYQLLAMNSSAFSAYFLPGDANRDDKVSFADYLALEANFGKSGRTWAQGDFNNDGKVSFADYLLLEANFGKSVPEPAALALLVTGGLFRVRGWRKA